MAELRCDLAIVGAGPAGLSAAVTASRHGASVVVIDEQPAPGGQIFRQPAPHVAAQSQGEPARLQRDLHRQGRRLLAEALEQTGIRWLRGYTAWGLFPPDEPAAGDGAAAPWLAVDGPDGVHRVAAGRVLLAPGAYEWPVPFPGWTLPGVMTAGGLQALVKSQKLLPGRRFLLAGAHPLLLVLAEQLLEAGAELAAVCFVQRRPPLPDLRGLGSLVRHAPKVLELAGVLGRLVRARVPVLAGHIVVAAEGEGGVEKAFVAPVDASGCVHHDRRQAFACDIVALGFGFLASSELARQAGCHWRWEPFGGGWVVEHDRWFRSSLSTVFVAGEITGVAGAEVAMLEGRVAAYGALADLGFVSEAQAEALAAPWRQRLQDLYALARMLHRAASFPLAVLAQLMDDDTVICRCEGVRAGELRTALGAHPFMSTTSSAKLYTRAGMGPCQGRLCNVSVLQLLRQETRPVPVDPFNARPPVKPVLIDHLLRDT